jgi:hypothetical protein|tara:strand:+ start:107 stop:280 length:174 start_codon:yes stop_codon:yes gene_type:complete
LNSLINYSPVRIYNSNWPLNSLRESLKAIDLEEQSKGIYLLRVNVNGTIQEFKVFKE